MCHAVEDVLADKIWKQSLNILVWYLNTVQITDTSVYQIILSTRFPSVPVYYLPLQRKFFKESKLQQSLAFSVISFSETFFDCVVAITGNPGSVIVPQYGSSKITVFVWGKNTILKFLGNTK